MLQPYITNLINSATYLALAFALFIVGRLIYKLFHKSININNELVEKDNFAFTISYVGYFVGLLIAIGSAIVGPSKGLLIDILEISVYGLLAIVLLNISRWFNDKVILKNFSITKEIIEDRNIGTGVIEAANSIASGLIIFGAITGDSGGIEHGLITAVFFWLIGQVLLLLAAWVYNLITPYNVHDHIEKDNVAVGIGFAGAILAMGNLIRFGLMGHFETWGETLLEVGFEATVGLILLPVGRLLADKILLPKTRSLTDEIINQEKPNVGAALVEAFAYVGSSVLISWCL